ncbi:MAG TPA: sodium:proton antiporter [Rhodospirillaceae bacterium]|nr:sodium:proton antiporter [Rhodospirillaceae bacterium]
MTIFSWVLALVSSLFALPVLASEGVLPPPDSGLIGWAVIGLFVLAYGVVLLEEKIHLRKSKPVTVAAGLIWILVAIAYTMEGRGAESVILIRQTVLEYAELLLFLLAAMTYVNVLEERGVFDALRTKMINQGLSTRAMYWFCGTFAFFLSPIADNLTTALILGSVSLAVGKGNPKFIIASCVNVVVAANAGGVFSPFGDITTLMVWQKGVVPFTTFFNLFIPALISWLIPAFVLSLTIPESHTKNRHKKIVIRRGGIAIIFLFLFTITLTVILHNTLHLPPFLGMMTGLGLLKIYGYMINKKETALFAEDITCNRKQPFNIFVSLKRIEWDTLFFFYGIIMCVGGIGALGYLVTVSEFFYTGLGETTTHTLIGVASAIIGNVPVTYAVLSMDQTLSHGQWLLVTLTAGIGGSLLSIGSAAGVALMGQARGIYTFGAHLKWAWAILIGYLAGIGAHLVINQGMF